MQTFSGTPEKPAFPSITLPPPDLTIAASSVLPTVRLKCLGSVLRPAARLIGCVPKFDQVAGQLRNILHWFLITQQIRYRVAALVWHCRICLTLPTLLSSEDLSTELWALAPFAQLSKVSFKFHFPTPRPGKAVLSQCLVPQSGIISF